MAQIPARHCSSPGGRNADVARPDTDAVCAHSFWSRLNCYEIDNDEAGQHLMYIDAEQLLEQTRYEQSSLLSCGGRAAQAQH